MFCRWSGAIPAPVSQTSMRTPAPVGLSVPAPGLVSRAVVVIELVGGLCLLAGLLTRVWALLLAAQMVSIVFVVKWDNGLVGVAGKSGFELELLIAASAATLFLIGPGLFAVDRALAPKREPEPAPRTGTAART